MALSEYLSETTALLRDANFAFISQNQLISWINRTRVTTAKRTGCIRRFVTGMSAWGATAQPGSAIPGGLQPGALPSAQLSTVGAALGGLQTIPGVERYPYRGFFNPYLLAQYSGVRGIVDSIQISVNWGGGGAFKPALDWVPFEDLQAYARSTSTQMFNDPAIWSVFNDGEEGEIWMWPPPSQVGDIELDATCLPTDILKDSDFDAIPITFKDAIKFGAASLAFLGSQRYAQAEVMDGLFKEALGVDRVAADRGKTTDHYQFSRF
jgi:hypothetical protein